jgi:hypothetical protein
VKEVKLAFPPSPLTRALSSIASRSLRNPALNWFCSLQFLSEDFRLPFVGDGLNVERYQETPEEDA